MVFLSLLYNRIRGKIKDKGRMGKGNSFALSVDREHDIVEILKTHVKSYDKNIFIDSIEEYVLKHQLKTPFKNGRPSGGWIKSFIARHADTLNACNMVEPKFVYLDEYRIFNYFRQSKTGKIDTTSNVGVTGVDQPYLTQYSGARTNILHPVETVLVSMGDQQYTVNDWPGLCNYYFYSNLPLYVHVDQFGPSMLKFDIQILLDGEARSNFEINEILSNILEEMLNILSPIFRVKRKYPIVVCSSGDSITFRVHFITLAATFNDQKSMVKKLQANLAVSPTLLNFYRAGGSVALKINDKVSVIQLSKIPGEGFNVYKVLLVEAGQETLFFEPNSITFRRVVPKLDFDFNKILLPIPCEWLASALAPFFIQYISSTCRAEKMDEKGLWTLGNKPYRVMLTEDVEGQYTVVIKNIEQLIETMPHNYRLSPSERDSILKYFPFLN